MSRVMAERVLVTKLGLDGHDRGVKIVALSDISQAYYNENGISKLRRRLSLPQ